MANDKFGSDEKSATVVMATSDKVKINIYSLYQLQQILTANFADDRFKLMLKFAPIFIILTFSAVSFFGFAMTSHESFHLCPAEQMQGRQCLYVDPLAVLAFHVEAFKSFTAGIFGVLVLAALMFLAAVFVPNRLLKLVPVRLSVQPRRLQELNFSSTLSAGQFLRWLYLRENSPSYR